MRNIIYPDEYLELIAAASKRGLTKKAAKELGIGGQMHHIIPRCVAPELAKEKSNIVFLTHEEHYNAHKLLALANPDDTIAIAWHRMTSGKNTKQFCTAEDYSKSMELNKNASKIMNTGRRFTEESKLKMRKPKSDETRKKMSASKTGVHRSEESKRKQSLSRKGKPKIKGSGKQEKIIVHIETNTIIKSCMEAERWAEKNNLIGCGNGNIIMCITGRYKSCGKDNNGEKQHWRLPTEEELQIYYAASSPDYMQL